MPRTFLYSSLQPANCTNYITIWHVTQYTSCKVPALTCFGTNVLCLQSTVVIEIPEDGTLVPKHVRVRT